MAFRAASADALAALTTQLQSAVSGSPERAATVAGDLFTVATTLRREGALRRFVTDAALGDEARSGVMAELFTGKVDEASLSLLVTAAQRRWTAPRDLADALEQLAVHAQVKAAGSDADRLADELFTFAQAIKDSSELRDALSDPARSFEAKRGLLHDLLGGKALASTVALAEQSLSGSYRTVGAALAAYQKLAAESHGQEVATVRTAHELSEGDLRRLTDLLTRQYGRPVHLNLLVDPSVIGGLRVEIGDDVIDGTVAGRLDDARRRLAS